MTAPEGRAVEGLAHLQGAAVQLIAAARAFLDVAEDLVRDPAAAATVVETLSALAGAARAEWPGAPPPEGSSETSEEPKVRPIRLSDER